MYDNQSGPHSVSSKVELYFSCQKLKSMDVMSKSDPAVQIEMLHQRKPGSRMKWKVIGCTEMVKDNHEPKFNKSIEVTYRFEKQQKFRFKVYDIDQKKFKGKIDEKIDDLIGDTQATLSEIVGAKGQTVRKPLKDGKSSKVGKSGFITIRAEEVGASSNDIITINAQGVKLKKMDVFGKSDGFYVLERRQGRIKSNNEYEVEEEGEDDNSEWVQIFKSEIVKKNLNPVWKPLKISMSKLCRCDPNMQIRCSVYDWDKNSSDDEIGYFYFTPQQLIDSFNNSRKKEEGGVRFTLKYDKKPKSRRGDIVLGISKIERRYSFFDYLRGNMEVSLVVAVDFTLSNGKPHKPTSLHFHGGEGNVDHMNVYQKAIRSIGDILCYYDSDNKYPAFGFGAEMDGYTSHCFALNGNEDDPEVEGVEGILSAYKESLDRVKLKGPTYFHEVIDKTIEYVNEEKVCQDLQKWHILLIITDGEVNKMYKTVHSIVQASFLPISIIIVGVGDDTDFQKMNELDCDEGLLESTYVAKAKKILAKDGIRKKLHKTARADIVQFVPFEKFENESMGLAAETLAEVPDQVVKFFKWKKIVPNPRPTVDFSQMMMGGGNMGYPQQQQQQQPQYGDSFE